MNLSDSFSLFLYAIKLPSKPDFTGCGWKKSFLEPEKNFFFSHVQDFFTKNNQTGVMVEDESCCSRYELNFDKQTEKTFLIKHLFSRPSLTPPAKDKQQVKFKLLTDSSVLAPALLYNPLTGICILSLGFSIAKESHTLQNLIDLNFRLRMLGKSDHADFLIAKNEHAAAQEQENKISLALANHIAHTKNVADEAVYKWNVQMLVKILLQGLDYDTQLSPNRLQVFTYLQTENRLDEPGLQLASFRLRRIYNSNYTPGADTEQRAETKQTFEQIHFGASIEGCAVIVSSDKEKLPPFLKDFAHTVKNRYIWSYLLAYFQRIAIIDMNDQLSHLYDEGQPDLSKLMIVSTGLSKIELRTLFKQVSFISQHNEFYEFCKHNLKIEELYSGITEKLGDVNRMMMEQMELEEKRRDIERANELYIKEQNLILERKVIERTLELQQEKKKSDDLLLNILPAEVADELKNHGTAAAKLFDNVTVIFTDFVGFTTAAEKLTPQELIDELHTCFKAFDEITTKYNVEKIKTIGDAYLAVCGLPVPDPNHAANVVSAAIEIRDFMVSRYRNAGNKTFQIRIGVNTGSVVAGIVGFKKFAYDIWGDTVNTASRMEQNSESDKINISQSTYDLVKNNFNCTYRGEIAAKNKGNMNMYFIEK